MKFCCYTPYNNNKRKCTKCKKKLIKNSKKNIFEKLPQDIIQYIFQFYLKSKYMYYYSNLSLVSKTFHNNFNILYKSLPCISYKKMKDCDKPIYYVRTKHFNIKFAKLYFNRSAYKFNLLFGEETILLSMHKINDTDVIFNKNEIYYLPYFDFIIV